MGRVQVGPGPSSEPPPGPLQLGHSSMQGPWGGRGGAAGRPGPEVHAVVAQGVGGGRGLRAAAGVEGAPRTARPTGHPGGAYFMPLRSTWLAAMSMTLMMKAMAKAQIRLLRTHV